MDIDYKNLYDEGKVAGIVMRLKDVGCDEETVSVFELLINCLRGQGIAVDDILNAFADFMSLYRGGEEND